MLRTYGKSLDTQDVYHSLACESKNLERTSGSVSQGLTTLSRLKPGVEFRALSEPCCRLQQRPRHTVAAAGSRGKAIL